MRLPLAVVLAAREKVRAVRMGPKMQRRIASLVAATRGIARHGNEPGHRIAIGAGPRASIAIERCARAHAWFAGRRQVTERDLVAVVHDVLRHRLELVERADIDGVTADALIDQLIAHFLGHATAR
jgi:MoxR-like ATPase